MLRDEISFQGNFTVASCHFCHKSSHLPIDCPLFHFVPDKDFLFKKKNHSSPQIRNPIDFKRKTKKSKNALKFNEEVEKNVINLSTSLYVDYLDQIPEIESQAEFEEISSPLSPGENHLLKRLSLSAVSENEELGLENQKFEEKDKNSAKLKQPYPIKLFSKIHSQMNSMAEIPENEVKKKKKKNSQKKKKKKKKKKNI